MARWWPSWSDCLEEEGIGMARALPRDKMKALVGEEECENAEEA